MSLGTIFVLHHKRTLEILRFFIPLAMSLVVVVIAKQLTPTIPVNVQPKL
jgi:hypothetical protein